MKFVTNIFLAGVLLLFMIVGCAKEHSVEHVIPITSGWSFTEGSNFFKGTVDSAYLDTVSGVVFLYLDGTADNAQDKISLAMYGTQITNGTYTSPQAYITYIQNSKVIYSNNANNADFSINLTYVDTATVTGTFSGKVVNGNGIEVNITNGRFSSPIKKVTIGSIPTGNLMVWAQNSCNMNDPIQIFVNGQREFISTFTSSEPDCGADGTANYTLPVGLYNVQSVCTPGDTVSNNVVVLPNMCNKLQLLE